MSKTIVITGAGSGLGRELARRFVSEGESVVVLGRTASKLEAVAAELGERCMPVACDVAKPDDVKAAFAKIAERHGQIDALINNAAIFQPSTVAEASDAHIVNTINTNLTGTVLCARSAIPLLRSNGHIINVTSESVELPFAMLVLYQSSKAGVEQFTKSLHRELRSTGVRVTSVRAGQMYGEGTSLDADPETIGRFFEACGKNGINLMEGPLSTYASVTQVFRNLLDLPADVHVVQVGIHARAGHL
jgi:meso-butanediol dehydrogenase/(S,S)-butanediol dehydrogenase/diacetyl reductase